MVREREREEREVRSKDRGKRSKNEGEREGRERGERGGKRREREEEKEQSGERKRVKEAETLELTAMNSTPDNDHSEPTKLAHYSTPARTPFYDTT